mgnify:CR=1 FL=1
MSVQDTWKRITLRLPDELHKKLVKAAELSSLNAEIVSRLDYSFDLSRRAEAQMKQLAESETRLIATISDLRTTQTKLEDQAQTLVNLAEKYWDRLQVSEERVKELEQQIAEKL